jgi:uncharacterized protein YjiS (DUF1127 family)
MRVLGVLQGRLPILPGPSASHRGRSLLRRLFDAAGAVKAHLAARGRGSADAADALARLDTHTLRDIGLCSGAIDALRDHRWQDAERWLGRGGGAF